MQETMKNEILIIEDSQAVSMLMTEFLKKLGYDKVHIANTGNDGLKKFQNITSGGILPIVFLDHSLPDTNSNEIMNQMFRLRPDVKIILETAEGRDETVVKDALRQGAYMYLQKPIRFDNIRETMKTVEEENPGSASSEFENKIDPLVLSSSRISLARLSELTQITREDVNSRLKDLIKEGKIMQIGKIKEISCNLCDSVNITQNFSCPSCRGFNFKQGKLIEHFTCGNVSLEESYKENICPKCHKEIKIIGVDYKIIENYYICNDCENKFAEPNTKYLCTRCDNSFSVEHGKWVTSEGFKSRNSVQD